MTAPFFDVVLRAFVYKTLISEMCPISRKHTNCLPVSTPFVNSECLEYPPRLIFFDLATYEVDLGDEKQQKKDGVGSESGADPFGGREGGEGGNCNGDAVTP